jgi:hypothetical protein
MQSHTDIRLSLVSKLNEQIQSLAENEQVFDDSQIRCLIHKADEKVLACALLNKTSRTIFSASKESGFFIGDKQLSFDEPANRRVIAYGMGSTNYGQSVVPILTKFGFVATEADSYAKLFESIISGQAEVAIIYSMPSLLASAISLMIKEAGGESIPIFGSQVDLSATDVQLMIGIQRELTGGVREIVRRNLKPN